MSEGLIVTALVVAVLVGITGAAFLVMRSPAFWGDVGKELFAKAWPQIWAVLSKRMSKEEEAEWHRAERQGRGDEWIRNRMRRKR